MNRQELEETLVKVERQPGLCNKDQLTCAHEFYTALNKRLNIYNSVHFHAPFGATIDMKLKDIQYYLDDMKGKK